MANERALDGGLFEDQGAAKKSRKSEEGRGGGGGGSEVEVIN